MARRRTSKRAQRRRKTVRHRGGSDYGVTTLEMEDGLKLNIVSFAFAPDDIVLKLSVFFVKNCWKNKAGPGEGFFWQRMFTGVPPARRPPGHYIYVTDAENNIVFAQLGFIKDGRPRGKLILDIMGTCTHMAHRGKGLFRKVLHKMMEYYKTPVNTDFGGKHHYLGHYNNFTLTADYKTRNEVNARARHIVFTKSGMRFNNLVEGTPYFVKTEDEKIYEVVPSSARTPELGEVPPSEVVIYDEARAQQKIPAARIIRCYSAAEGTEDKLIECPFRITL